jgi:hypothetical protein
LTIPQQAATTRLNRGIPVRAEGGLPRHNGGDRGERRRLEAVNDDAPCGVPGLVAGIVATQGVLDRASQLRSADEAR